MAMRTSLNRKSMTFPLIAILTFFSVTAVAQQTSTALSSNGGAILLLSKGAALSPQAVSDLENKVAQDPNDLDSQTMLLGFYCPYRATKDKHQKSEDMILLLIQNHPEAAVLHTMCGQILPFSQKYPEAERLWKEQLRKHPTDSQIVYNAGESFIHGNFDLAVNTFKLGKSRDPNSADWDRSLGNAYSLQFLRTHDPSVAAEELKHYESAYAKETPAGRNSLLFNMAEAAFKAGQLDKTIDYSNKMLSSNDTAEKGYMIYYGNYIRGMVAIKRGNVKAASRYLLLAGDTPGSPSLNYSGGLAMDLAKELLDRGQRDTVLAFLKKCSKFWTGPNSHCAGWIQEMEEGGTPIFTPLYLVSYSPPKDIFQLPH